jgi:hypothetical protein
VLGWVCLTSGLGLQAAETNYPFRFFTEVARIPERGEVASYTVIVQSNRFSFMAPAGWAVKADADAKSVTMQPPDLSTGIQLRWQTSPTNTASVEARAETNSWQQRALALFPGATIGAAFNGHSHAGTVEGFELERSIEKNVRVLSRVAFMRYGGGVMEVVHTGPPGRVREQHLALMTLMTSLQQGPWPPPAGAGRDRPGDGE